MPTRDFIPRNEGDKLTWFDNFSTKLATHAGMLGIPAGQLTQVQGDTTSLHTEVTAAETAKTTAASVVKHKQDVFAIVEKRVRDIIAIIKRNENYTEAIGADLGILLPTGPSGPPTLPVPEFTATPLPDRVRLDWIKGESDGISFQSKRGSEQTYTPLGKDTVSPFEDERPCLTPGTPEVRWYRGRYLLGDNEVGEWSNEVRVVVVF